MAFSEKFIRAQLNILKPIITGCSLEAARKSQDAVGALMAAEYRREVSFRSHAFSAFEGAWALPKDETRQGVILYLHGGGYTCGDLEYAKGFGAMLAASCGLMFSFHVRFKQLFSAMRASPKFAAETPAPRIFIFINSPNNRVFCEKTDYPRVP